MAAEYVKRLGERIRARREELGMTQEQVAREMPGRVSGSRISLWERGENKPRDDSLEHLAEVLDTTVAALSVGPPAKTETPEIFSRNASNAQLDRVEAQVRESVERSVKFEELLTELVERVSSVERLVSVVHATGSGKTNSVSQLGDIRLADEAAGSGAFVAEAMADLQIQLAGGRLVIVELKSQGADDESAQETIRQVKAYLESYAEQVVLQDEAHRAEPADQTRQDPAS